MTGSNNPFIGSDEATRLEFSAKIRAMWRALLSHIIGVGTLLIEAKDELPHGHWLILVKKELPFGEREAQRLMAIAKDQRLTNATHAPHLPPYWTTLYVLHKLSDSAFQAALNSGKIHPGMERADAEALVGLQRAAAKDAAEDEFRELIRASRQPDPIDQARKVYLDLAQKAPTVRRGHELWLLNAALGSTALEKFLRNVASRKNADERQIFMAEALGALRTHSDSEASE